MSNSGYISLKSKGDALCSQETLFFHSLCIMHEPWGPSLFSTGGKRSPVCYQRRVEYKQQVWTVIEECDAPQSDSAAQLARGKLLTQTCIWLSFSKSLLSITFGELSQIVSSFGWYAWTVASYHNPAGQTNHIPVFHLHAWHALLALMMNLLRQAWHHSVTDGARLSTVEENAASFITSTTVTTSNNITDNNWSKKTICPPSK